MGLLGLQSMHWELSILERNHDSNFTAFYCCNAAVID